MQQLYPYRKSKQDKSKKSAVYYVGCGHALSHNDIVNEVYVRFCNQQSSTTDVP